MSMDLPAPRGPVGDHLVVRLADEGVPVAAIARVTKRPFDDVALIIDAACASSTIASRPPPDWPHGQTRYVPTSSEVHARNRDGLRSLDQAAAMVPFAFRLTGKETCVLGALILRPELSTKNFLHNAVYGLDVDGGAEPKIIDVFICKIRNKLRAFRVEIGTIWGRGYCLDAKSLAEIVRIRREETAGLNIQFSEVA